MTYKLFIKENKIKIDNISDADTKTTINALIAKFDDLCERIEELEADDDDDENKDGIQALIADKDEIDANIIKILQTELDDELDDDIDAAEKIERFYNAGQRKIVDNQLYGLGLSIKDMPYVAGTTKKFGNYLVKKDYQYSTFWTLSKI